MKKENHRPTLPDSTSAGMFFFKEEYRVRSRSKGHSSRIPRPRHPSSLYFGLPESEEHNYNCINHSIHNILPTFRRGAREGPGRNLPITFSLPSPIKGTQNGR